MFPWKWGEEHCRQKDKCKSHVARRTASRTWGVSGRVLRVRAERRWGKANGKSLKCSEQVKCSCFKGGPGTRAESGRPVVQVGDDGSAAEGEGAGSRFCFEGRAGRAY